MAIRLVHLSTGDDGESHFTEGEIDFAVLDDHTRGKILSSVATVTFAESPPGSRLSWHTAPHRQYVITTSGTLTFETRNGEQFTVGPGDVILAEDTTGGGHRWWMIDGEPWRRVYVEV
jgi:quercetin dioxygenase-like cupin family protein